MIFHDLNKIFIIIKLIEFKVRIFLLLYLYNRHVLIICRFFLIF